MKEYLELLKDVLENGVDSSDRTGTGTLSVFGRQSRYSLVNKLPAITTKKLAVKAVLHELMWIISGDSKIDYLQENNVKIWDEWADDKGSVGPLYPTMWRRFEMIEQTTPHGVKKRTIDQLQNTIDLLRAEPDTRRAVVSCWHPGLLPNSTLSPKENAALGKQCLPPCHTLFQFYTQVMTMEQRVENYNFTHEEPINLDLEESQIRNALEEANIPKRYLSCQLYQRSGDMFLGVPFNILSYSVLTYMVAKLLNFAPYEFVHSLGDAHIYSNHIDQVKKQLARSPKDLCTLKIHNEHSNIDDFKFDDFELVNYESHAPIKAKVAV